MEEGRGVRTRGKREQERHRRWERKGGSYKRVESGRKEGNYETMLNIEKGLKAGSQAKWGGRGKCPLSPYHTFCEPPYISQAKSTFLFY